MRKNILQGYDKFYRLTHEIDVLFDKNEMLGKYQFDITEIKKGYDKLYNAVEKITKSNGFITEPNKSIKIDSQSYDINSINNKVESLISKLNDMITPLYTLYVLMNSVNKINSIKKEKYLSKLTDLSKLLIYYIDNYEIQNTTNIKALVDDACSSLYEALLLENSCNRTDILDYLNSKELSISKDNVTSILRDELISKKIVPFTIDIKLEPKILKKVNHVKVNNDMNNDTKTIKDKIVHENQIINNYDNEIKDINKNKWKYLITFLLYHSIPLAAAGAGLGIGLGISAIEKHYYKNDPVLIIRDLNTDEVVYKDNSLSELPTDYNKTIHFYSPWIWDKDVESYKRTISEFNVYYDGKSSELTEDELNKIFDTKIERTEYKRDLEPGDEIKDTIIRADEYSYREGEDNSLFTKIVMALLPIVVGIGSFIIIIKHSGELKYVELNNRIKTINSNKKERTAKIAEYEKQLQYQVLKDEEIDGYSEIDLAELLGNKNALNKVLSR